MGDCRKTKNTSIDLGLGGKMKKMGLFKDFLDLPQGDGLKLNWAVTKENNSFVSRKRFSSLMETAKKSLSGPTDGSGEPGPAGRQFGRDDWEL